VETKNQAPPNSSSQKTAAMAAGGMHSMKKIGRIVFDPKSGS
jgi:hypothetical protein